jgi:hypothetical protein
MGPGGLRFTLDREMHLPKPADGIEELGVREADHGVVGGSAGTLMPMERPTSEKHSSPLRRHSRAGTAGAARGHSERYRAAESSTASSDVTHEAS